MKFASFGIVCALFACAASAQTTTLTYQGYVMGGTSSYEPIPKTALDIDEEVLQVSSTTAAYTATLIVKGSVAAHNLVVTSYAINLAGSAASGQSFAFSGLGVQYSINPPTSNNNETCFDDGLPGTNGCITILTKGSKVVGAKLSFTQGTAMGPGIPVLKIALSGDSFEYVQQGDATFCDLNNFGALYGNPCYINLSNPTKGVWTVKPHS